MLLMMRRSEPAAKTLSPFGCRIARPDRGEGDFNDNFDEVDGDSDDFGDGDDDLNSFVLYLYCF